MDAEEKKGWFNRNWRWFIPVGAVSFILTLAAFAGAIVLFVMGAIKSTDVYQEALIKAKSDAVVLRELGEPVEAGWLISGSIEMNNSSGQADIKIPISGPRNSGTIHAVATKKDEIWSFSILEVEIKGQTQKINLLGPS